MASNCSMRYGCSVPDDMSHDGHLRHHQRMLGRLRTWRRIHALALLGFVIPILTADLSRNEVTGEPSGWAFILFFYAAGWLIALGPLYFSDLHEKQRLAVEYLTEKWVKEHVDGG